MNAVHEWSLPIKLNDYLSPYSLLLEEAQQIGFQQRRINSLMMEVYMYLNGHSPGITNDFIKLRENMHNIWNFDIFQTENSRSLKYDLDAIPYRASRLDIRMKNIKYMKNITLKYF